MPWKECHVMDERLRFVARLLEGEKMAPLCAEFGISRKTGYKIFDRYKDCGVQAFSDRSHRAHRQANRLPATGFAFFDDRQDLLVGVLAPFHRSSSVRRVPTPKAKRPTGAGTTLRRRSLRDPS